MSRQKFDPNCCNMGGKQQIEMLQEKHLLALINSKANIVIKPPHLHVDANKTFSIKDKQDYTETYETYRRINALKCGYSDSSMPKSYQMKEALKRKNKVSQFVSEQNHLNNIKSLQNNIIEIHNRANRNIQKMKSNSRIHSIASSIKENSRLSKKEWDTRSSHPLEYEWKPDSAFSRSKYSKGENTIMTNIFSIDSTTWQKQQSTSKRNQEAIPFDYTHAGLTCELEDEDFFIHTDTQKQPETPSQLHPYESIINKKDKSSNNVIIPIIKPSEKMSEVKRRIYQTLMDYNLFQRDQVYQIGLAYANKNKWLDEEQILNECNKISKQLYGIE